jgi:hypothetical protein
MPLIGSLCAGVEYSGVLPTYEFADPELTKRVKAVRT